MGLEKINSAIIDTNILHELKNGEMEFSDTSSGTISVIADLEKPVLSPPIADAKLHATVPHIDEATIEQALQQDPPSISPIEIKEVQLEQTRDALLEQAGKAKIEAYKTLNSAIITTISLGITSVASTGTNIPLAAISLFVLITAIANVVLANINFARAEKGEPSVTMKELLQDLIVKTVEKLPIPESIRSIFNDELFNQAEETYGSVLDYANKVQEKAVPKTFVDLIEKLAPSLVDIADNDSIEKSGKGKKPTSKILLSSIKPSKLEEQPS